MSMYSIVMGENLFAKSLASMIFQTHEVTFGRIRDAWVEDHGEDLLIRVHTRNGGGNREGQAEAINSMRAHPWYVRDEDLDYDNTYADFYFRPNLVDLRRTLDAKINGREHEYQSLSDDEKDEVIANVKELFVKIAQPPVDVGALWVEAVERLKQMDLGS